MAERAMLFLRRDGRCRAIERLLWGEGTRCRGGEFVTNSCQACSVNQTLAGRAPWPWRALKRAFEIHADLVEGAPDCAAFAGKCRRCPDSRSWNSSGSSSGFSTSSFAPVVGNVGDRMQPRRGASRRFRSMRHTSARRRFLRFSLIIGRSSSDMAALDLETKPALVTNA